MLHLFMRQAQSCSEFTYILTIYNEKCKKHKILNGHECPEMKPKKNKIEMHALSVPKMKLKILNRHECPEKKLKQN